MHNWGHPMFSSAIYTSSDFFSQWGKLPVKALNIILWTIVCTVQFCAQRGESWRVLSGVFSVQLQLLGSESAVVSKSTSTDSTFKKCGLKKEGGLKMLCGFCTSISEEAYENLCVDVCVCVSERDPLPFSDSLYDLITLFICFVPPLNKYWFTILITC